MMNPTTLILTLANTPTGITTNDLAHRLSITHAQALPVLTRLRKAGAVVREGRRWRLTVSVAEAVSRYINATVGDSHMRSTCGVSAPSHDRPRPATVALRWTEVPPSARQSNSAGR